MVVAARAPVRALTFLHLSDLHFGQARGEASQHFDQERVTRLLLNDIVSVADKLGAPDAVLVTGDIAFSGQDHEYVAAMDWLEHLCKTLRVETDRLWLVPGNHDVNRREVLDHYVPRVIHESLRKNPAHLSQVLLEHSDAQEKLKATLLPKFRAYATFVEKLRRPMFTASAPFWTQRIDSALGPVVVIGLNTCLLSYDNDDAPSTLALGAGQLERLFREIPDNALVVVLGHHPPEWLCDGSSLVQYLQKHPNVLFTGHVHDQGGLVTHPLHCGGILHFVAGAGHKPANEQGKHAYAWVRLRVQGVDLFPRYLNDARQGFQPERNTFELVPGQEYVHIPRTRSPVKLEQWLPPDPDEPQIADLTRRKHSLELRDAVERLERLKAAQAAPEVLRKLKGEILRLKRALRDKKTLRAGDVLDNRYLLVEHLRTGGFAHVWKSKDLRTGQQVAIKVLKADLVEQEDLRTRFERGNRELHTLRHVHICPLIEPLQQEEDGREDGDLPLRTFHYYVLALADGGDFEQWVLAKRPSWKAVVAVMIEVARALEHAHTHGCIHRDVKPPNILLTGEGRAWLTDFDLAKLVDSTLLTETGMTMGTAFYAAPEQHDPKGEVVFQSDVFSLGMTLLFGLLARALTTADQRRFEAVVRGLAVPEALKQAILRSSELDPAERFPTMLAFRQALEAVLQETTMPQPSAPSLAPSGIGQQVDARDAELKRLEAQVGTGFEEWPVTQRIAVLLELGKKGDPRLGMEKADRWVTLPAATFTMGDKLYPENYQFTDVDGTKYKTRDIVTPEHPVTLTKPFSIGRFPVTHQEFRRFVEAGGYQEAKWWSADGWKWLHLKEEGLLQKLLSSPEDSFDAYFKKLIDTQRVQKEWRANFLPSERPYLWDDARFSAPNQPVIGVSWWEARAYCRWLTAQLNQDKPAWWRVGMEVRLPTEAQWEYAARGTEARRYAWGDKPEPDEEHANFDSKVGRTTPVGAYPRGTTPHRYFRYGRQRVGVVCRCLESDGLPAREWREPCPQSKGGV